MLPSITALLVLQDRDQTLRELQRDLERIPLEVARAKTRLEGSELGLEKARKALQENELAIRKLEMDVKTRRESITRLHLQRFETRKNEEYTAMGHEIENYESQVHNLEDTELDLMEQAEKLKAAFAEAQAAEAAIKRDVEDEIKAFALRKQTEEERIKEVEADRAVAIAGIPDEAALALYQRLAPRKFPPVVAIELGDNCGGCHMKLTNSTATEVKLGKRLVPCDHCGRIVYLS